MKMKDQISLFLDCGAPSLYNFLSRNKESASSGAHSGAYFIDRKHDDFSFIETEEYKKYRDDYIGFLKEYSKSLNVYSNLDVINNAEATYDNQLYIESKGLKPIPVFHLGEDPKWLAMYIEKYKYIALGGITPNPATTVIPILDPLWQNFICNSQGMPRVKVHGFAVTGIELMERYPWYSVDSTSWLMTSVYGKIMVPKKRNGEYAYNKTPSSIAVSTRTGETTKGTRLVTMTKVIRDYVLDYISTRGYELGESIIKQVKPGYELDKEEGESYLKDTTEFVEKVIKVGIINSYELRAQLNMLFFKEFEKLQPPWPWPFKRRVNRLGLLKKQHI